MKIHRFIYPFNATRTSIHIADALVVEQMRSVLRLKVGDLVLLADGKGHEVLCAIEKMTTQDAFLRVRDQHDNKNESKRDVHLYCAILKRENFELVVQKATEVGIAEITPLITSRTVKLGLRYDRLEKIVKEAAEQAGRGVVPLLHESMPFEQVLIADQPDKQRILFDVTARQPLGALSEKAAEVFIGPEGGWDPEEIAQARAHSFHIATLGPLTLRAETAAIIGSYLSLQQ